MNIDIRTICVLLWEKELVSIIFSIFINGFLVVILTAFLEAHINGRKKMLRGIIACVIVLFICLVLTIISCVVAQDSVMVPPLKGKTYEEVKDALDEAGVSANLEYRYQEEETQLGTIREDGTIEGVIPLNVNVIEQNPSSKRAMAKSGATIILYVSKDKTQEATLDYSSAMLLDSYVKYDWAGEEKISFFYPQSLFSVQNPTDKECPLYNADKYLYLEGAEQGLYAWVSTTPKRNEISMEEIIESYERFYMDYMGEAHTVKEDVSNVAIITGYREKEIGYVLVAVEDSYVNTIYISFPYEGILDKTDFSKEMTDLYGDYAGYYKILEEDYRLKSYMVKVMYSLCSFSHSNIEIEPYEEYSITWPLPSLEKM